MSIGTSVSEGSSSEATIGSGRVIVGVDGSPNAQRALALAGSLAVALDVELVVFHALGLMTVVDGRHVPVEGHRDEIEHIMRTQWCRPLAQVESLRWRAEIIDGNPASVMVAMGSELGASLVVVGSRGIGEEQTLGSTSHHIVHHCDRPVVVVPPADRTLPPPP